jgi:hypothetical protein
VDEHTCLGVLSRKKVAIDGNAPALVHPHLRIASHAIDNGRQLWAEQEDVDTAKG